MHNTMIEPRKRPRQARSRALVEAILDAAAHILAQHGREALTTNAVAVKAGVSVGSLYQYFPNRDAIIAAVAGRHGHRVYHLVADLDLKDCVSLELAITRMAARLFAAHAIDPALHKALDGDVAQRHTLHHHHHHRHDRDGDEGHAGTKAAMVAQLCNLTGPARQAVRRTDMTLAAVTVGEIIHALAHAAIIHGDDRYSSACFEREAVRAAVTYLTAPE